jgi:hypothetical protein
MPISGGLYIMSVIGKIVANGDSCFPWFWQDRNKDMFETLAVFEMGWVSIFVALAVIAVSLASIIMLTVWLTGGFSGRN